MKISCIQFNMKAAAPDINFMLIKEKIEQTAKEEKPDCIVLPETWNTGFFRGKTLGNCQIRTAAEQKLR